MGFRYTKATRNIINFINDYGFITINVCADIFYKGKSNPIHQARVKLSTLADNNVVTKYRLENGEYLFQTVSKNISEHRRYMVKLYGYLYRNFDIEYFKLEEVWKVSNKRSDAHIIVHNGERRVGLLIEFEHYHNTKKDKLDEIYNSNEVQQWYMDKYNVSYYPITIMITPSGNCKIVNCDDLEYCVFGTNYKFDGLADMIKDI